VNLNLKVWTLGSCDLFLFGVITIVPITIYLAFIGAYLEVPADVWAHLGAMQDLFSRYFLQHHSFGHDINTYILGHSQGVDSLVTNGVWYFTVPWLAELLRVRVEALVEPLTLVNTLIFLTGIYLFSLHAFRVFSLANKTWLLAGALSTILCFFHFGVDVFSYVRYYVAAPAFLNHLIFLGTLIVFIDLIERPPRTLLILFLFLANLVSMAFIHLQEALFAVVMVVGLSVFFLVQQMCRPGTIQARASAGQIGLVKLPLFGRCLCWIIVITAAGLCIWQMFSLDWLVDRKLPFVIPLSTIVNFDVVIVSSGIRLLSELFIANPGFRIYDSVTVWGLVVYLIFIVRIRYFLRSPLLTVGMLSPLLTVFDPFFVSAFLRFAPPEVVWRFIYIVPLYAVGAVIIATTIEQIKRAKRTTGGVVTVVLLLVWALTLFPVDWRYLQGVPSQPTRMTTITKVPDDNSASHWSDLFVFLRSLPTSYDVLTDPITGYLTRGLTQHRYSGGKFSNDPNLGYINFNENLSQDSNFDRYENWLLVVNQREGGTSRNGELSGHWRKDQLKLLRYYSDELLPYIHRNSEQFKLLWLNSNIGVYKIVQRTM